MLFAGGRLLWLPDAGAQVDRMRRIGVLMGYAESDRQGQANFAALREGLRSLGWTEGRDIRIDTRWAAADADLTQRFAKELVTLQPDVILMDVAMPHKNGIEATQEIHGTLPHIQIVGLSTYDDETTERAMREAGAQAYFSKTESTDRLFDYVLSLRPQAKGASTT